MRSIKHWTPRYIADRINLWVYERKFPDRPWLTRTATDILTDYLKETDIGLEFGSGRSTLWFSKRVSKLISVEHDPIWYEKVKNQLSENKFTNCSYHLCPSEANNMSEDDAFDTAYVHVAREVKDNSLDFALVDGKYRSACAITLIEKIRPAGILIIDNINWYLPRNTFSPESRNLKDGPASANWARFQMIITNWRCIWTSNGIFDTVIYFKPCGE